MALLPLRASTIEPAGSIKDRQPAAVGYRIGFVNIAMASLADGFYRVADRDHSGKDAYPRGSCEGTIVI
jgi:hypothetical protein